MSCAHLRFVHAVEDGSGDIFDGEDINVGIIGVEAVDFCIWKWTGVGVAERRDDTTGSWRQAEVSISIDGDGGMSCEERLALWWFSINFSIFVRGPTFTP